MSRFNERPIDARLALLVFSCLSCCEPLLAEVPFSIQGPGVNPGDFRMTTFATGLNYPVGMTELSDGSIMVAVSTGSRFFDSSSGSIIRLADTDRDGVADQETILYSNVPGGRLTSLRVVGDLVFVTGQGSGKPISILRSGATPSDPLTYEGQINIDYPGGWQHTHSALAVRPTPSRENSYDLIFQVGSKTNFETTTETVSMTSSIGISADLAGDAVHMVTITDDGKTVAGTGLQQIATGLRNSAGFAWHPVTGDLYLQDNGIDGVVNASEPTSADELNVIAVDQIGGDIEDFGFAENYTEYRTGTIIGGGGTEPLVAFQPLPSPDGEEGEGPNDIAFAPAAFPAALGGGIFVGMHGQFSRGGTSNEENPLVFVDLIDNSYFHFISNDEQGVGHLDGLLPTSDSLFIADISTTGGFSEADTGAIYKIESLVPERAAGDTNDDGLVNIDDLNNVRNNFRAMGPADGSLDGDAYPFDGLVNIDDINGVRNNFGAGAAAVPEPSGLALALLIAFLAVIGRRRCTR